MKIRIVGLIMAATAAGAILAGPAVADSGSSGSGAGSSGGSSDWYLPDFGSGKLLEGPTGKPICPIAFGDPVPCDQANLLQRIFIIPLILAINSLDNPTGSAAKH